MEGDPPGTAVQPHGSCPGALETPICEPAMSLARLDGEDVLYLSRDHRKSFGFHHHAGHDPRSCVERVFVAGWHRERDLVALQANRILQSRSQSGLHFLQNAFRSNGRTERHRRRQHPRSDQFDIALIEFPHLS